MYVQSHQDIEEVLIAHHFNASIRSILVRMWSVREVEEVMNYKGLPPSSNNTSR